MLYVFVGDDVVKVRKEAHAFLASRGEYERVTGENYREGMFPEYAQSVSLFGEGNAPVLLDFLSEDDDALAALEKNADVLAESSRIFVVMDFPFLAAMTRALKKHAEKYTEIQGTVEKQRFNSFLLADALAEKDKKALWILLMRARLAGIASEELAGTLFWQLKALQLAESTKSAAEADMKEFPYQKAKRSLKNFQKGEVRTLSERLLRVYHDGHADKDMDIELERFVLMI